MRRPLSVSLAVILGIAAGLSMAACTSGSSGLPTSPSASTSDAAATDRSLEGAQFLAATCPVSDAIAEFNDAWTGATTTVDDIHVFATVARDASAGASRGLASGSAPWAADVTDDLAVLRADYDAAIVEFDAIIASDSIEFLNGFAFRDNSAALAAYSRVIDTLDLTAAECPST